MKKAITIIYQIFIFIPIGILATIVTAIIVMIGCTLGSRKFWGYYPCRYWSKFVCYLALCRAKVVVRGQLDANQSYIFVPNHQSAFDIFLIYGFLGQNIKWVQKKELRKLPFVGIASEIAGHVYVDQSSLKSMKETIKKAQEKIEPGVSICIFPEGQRTESGGMNRFKRGAFLIAKELELPIVPITVNGAFDVMKIHTYLINPGKMELIIHQPIPTKGLSDEDIPALISQAYNEVHCGLWDKNK